MCSTRRWRARVGLRVTFCIQALTKAVDVYRDPLLGDVAWTWVEPIRLEYRGRYIGAALQLADLLARADPARSDGLAESAIAIAPETDIAYERLIQNALARRNALEVRRLRNRYVQAAQQYGFTPDPRLAVRSAGAALPAARFLSEIESLNAPRRTMEPNRRSMHAIVSASGCRG